MNRAIKYIPLTFITSSAEKERLIRNTVLLRHFADEPHAEVDLAYYIEGTQYGFNAPATETGTNKYVRISDISNGEIAWETVPFCDCDEPESYLLKKDDIVIARTGGTTGKSYMVSAPPPGSIYAGYLIRVRANQQTNPLFLSVFLNSYIYWSQITSLNRDEFRPSVNAEKLKALRLPQFERNLQDRVVRLSNNPAEVDDSSIQSELHSVLTKRNRQESIVAEIRYQELLLEKLKQAILQEAISGKLTADWRAANPNVEPASQILRDIEIERAHLIAAKRVRPGRPHPKITPGEIPFQTPEKWRWCRFADVQLGSDAGSSPRCEERPVTGKEWGILKVSATSGAGFRQEENKFFQTEVPDDDGTVVRDGDFILSRANTKELVGNSVTVEGLTLNLLLSDKTIRFRIADQVDSRYANIVNKAAFVRAHFIDNATGASPSMKNLAREGITSHLFPLPPFEEQVAIVERVDGLMQHCRTLAEEIERSRDQARHLLEAILREAFSPRVAKAFATDQPQCNLDSSGQIARVVVGSAADVACLEDHRRNQRI